MQRRDLMAAAGIAVLGLASKRAAAATRDVVVCVFQRGAMDGLNVVAPVAEGRYYDLRPSIAVREADAIDLDGFFGLHPAAAALEPFYRNGQLAMVHATGASEADRSHFSAQSLMERAVNAGTNTFSGWLGRHLEMGDGTGSSALRGVSIANALEQAMAGSGAAAAIPDSSSFVLRSRFGEPWLSEAVRPYRPLTVLGRTGTETAEVLKKIATEKPFELPPDNDAAYPATGFGGLMKQAAQYIKADIGVEVICVSIGGWDHHAGEVQAMPGVLGEFANSLAAFATDLGARMQNVTVISMSEFGRRAQENASGGTDHGRGNVMFAMGGGVNGGKVYGDWPGLAESRLEEGDLAITTDYRQVLMELLAARAGNGKTAETFPGFSGGRSLGLFKGF